MMVTTAMTASTSASPRLKAGSLRAHRKSRRRALFTFCRPTVSASSSSRTWFTALRGNALAQSMPPPPMNGSIAKFVCRKLGQNPWTSLCFSAPSPIQLRARQLPAARVPWRPVLGLVAEWLSALFPTTEGALSHRFTLWYRGPIARRRARPRDRRPFAPRKQLATTAPATVDNVTGDAVRSVDRALYLEAEWTPPQFILRPGALHRCPRTAPRHPKSLLHDGARVTAASRRPTL